MTRFNTMTELIGLIGEEKESFDITKEEEDVFFGLMFTPPNTRPRVLYCRGVELIVNK